MQLSEEQQQVLKQHQKVSSAFGNWWREGEAELAQEMQENAAHSPTSESRAKQEEPRRAA
ncbi:hypothetical protein NA78x_005472 [Anatilimnocola sp. NA78]|uniref:hypothetical protein n=1 Tax=Anatilimnocola sp. NA78 TaxID=3415683 RepID=UPI003CE4E4AE